MARTTLVPQVITRAGIEPDFTEAANADGESIVNDGKVFVYVDNQAVGAIDVTFLIPGLIDGEAIADGGRVEEVPAEEARFFGPFPTSVYNQADGCLYVDFSAVVTVSVAAFK